MLSSSRKANAERFSVSVAMRNEKRGNAWAMRAQIGGTIHESGVLFADERNKVKKIGIGGKITLVVG